MNKWINNSKPQSEKVHLHPNDNGSKLGSCKEWNLFFVCVSFCVESPCSPFNCVGSLASQSTVWKVK